MRCPNCGNTDEQYFEDNGENWGTSSLTVICKAPVSMGNEAFDKWDILRHPDLEGICNYLFQPFGSV